MPRLDDLRGELAQLRAELLELKRCQVQYFTLSVTGTGAVLGLAGSLNDATILGPSLLAPLAIIIPSWWIFFDKATTITRIVGYVRVLESILWMDSPQDDRWTGFERGLRLYRDLEERIRSGQASKPTATPPAGPFSSWRLLRLSTRHRYWMINWYTFCGLAVLCCIFGWYFFSGPARSRWIWVGVAVAVVVFSAAYNFLVIRQLTAGRYSYDHNEVFWRAALDRPNPNVADGRLERSDATRAAQPERQT